MVGFDARNKDIINQLYICRSCSLILREPFQLECGHRQCKTCVENTEGEIITCVECSEQTQKKEILLDRGFRNDMKVLQIVCSFCEWNGLFKDYETHLNQAHQNPICEFCEKEFNSRILLGEHKQKECPKITVPCSLKDYGCSNSLFRAQMAEHYLSDLHKKAIINFAIRALTKPSNHQETVSGMGVDGGQATACSMITTTNENLNIQVQELYERIRSHASRLLVLNDEKQSLRLKSIGVQAPVKSLTQWLATPKLSTEEQSSFLDGIKSNQEILLQNIASLKQRIYDMQYVSYDGTLIWKIPNFREKMMDAQSERQTSIYSPPFYSSHTGYKMCARLYLNGDGNARGTHLSLAFVLMRGPYDAILTFPFNYKVTFCLYDQTSHQQHEIHTLLPDTKSISFQRPRSEMNIASGIPKFIPLSMIQQEGNPYVQDDTMLIKVMIDFGDTPKTLLPDAFGLNPDLSIHSQQTKIKQELERRAQQGLPSEEKVLQQQNLPHEQETLQEQCLDMQLSEESISQEKNEIDDLCEIISNEFIENLSPYDNTMKLFVEEISFKVTRIRCWKVNSIKQQDINISFEYLIKKDTLQWIIIHTKQTPLVSTCLQSMIDEILTKKLNSMSILNRSNNQTNIVNSLMTRTPSDLNRFNNNKLFDEGDGDDDL